MKVIVLFFAVIFLTACNENDVNTNPPEIKFTEITGKQSGELIFTQSPYRITQDIIVDSNKTLIIKPGVQLFFEENTKLIVYGELLVEGTNSQFVLFKSYNSSKNWKGINLINADKTAHLNFVMIQDILRDTDTLSSSISIYNSQAEFIHSIIFNNTANNGGALGVFNSNLVLQNCILHNNNSSFFGGAIFSETSDIKIVNNTFFKNNSANSGGTIFVFDPVKTELQNNIFYKNTSRIGNPNIEFASNDSSNLIEQFDYISFGSMNPKFIDESFFRLSPTSPCINNGNPDPAFNDSDNSRNDQGAYGGPFGKW